MAPAGSRLVSGLLANAKVSACDGAAEITGIVIAIAIATAANLLRDKDIISPSCLIILGYFLKVIGIKRS